MKRGAEKQGCDLDRGFCLLSDSECHFTGRVGGLGWTFVVLVGWLDFRIFRVRTSISEADQLMIKEPHSKTVGGTKT